MKKRIIITAIIFTCSLMLMACNDDGKESSDATNNNADHKENNSEEKTHIPKDVIKDADADPIELKDQMGLEIGDTGYAMRNLQDGTLSITLNGVERTQVLSEFTSAEGDEFFLIGDFTFENVSNKNLEIMIPDAARPSDESAIINDELGSNGDLLGVGGGFVNDDNKIPEGDPVNSINLEPGEKLDQKTSISMRDTVDEYMIVFGFFDGNNMYYKNKVAWTFESDQIVGSQ